MTIILTTYLLGLLACLLIAATHPGARPYTKGSYAKDGLLWRYWATVALIAVWWPVWVIWGGLVLLWEELT